MFGLYTVELGYFAMSVIAWKVLTSQDYSADDKCRSTPDHSGPQELVLDMIILDYMRCLKLISLITFTVLCGPVLLACWCTGYGRQTPTENPVSL